MRVAICDDDRPIVDDLHRKIDRLFQKLAVNVKIYDFTQGEDLLYEIETTGTFDLIFLDIEIGTMNGISLASELREKQYIFTLIFISQYDSYYRVAFEVQPFWFLNKPCDDRLLEKAITKVMTRIANREEVFDFSFNKVYYRIYVDDIMYIESSKRTVFLHCVDNKVYKCYNKLNIIEREFEEKRRRFIRVHRSFLVNQIYIKTYYYDKIILYNNEEIVISFNMRNKVRIKYIDMIHERIG